jgi:uncharacterized protein YukE
MPYETVSVQKARHFVPDEANRIAAELRAIASDARDITSRLRSIGGNLESTWEGRAQARYVDEFIREPSAGESIADWLEGQAQRVSSITVTEMETVLESVWVPYTNT